MDTSFCNLDNDILACMAISNIIDNFLCSISIVYILL